MSRTLSQRQRAVATIVAFRARVERVTPFEAAQMIADGHGSWDRWARQHRLAEAQMREVVESLATEGGGQS